MRQIEMTMIDNKYITLVKSIRDFGSMSIASKYLNISPSALSHQLRKIEEELQVTLFERRNNKLQITSAGEILYDYAEKIIVENNKVLSKIEDIKRKSNFKYVHGYSNFELNRLNSQASTINDFIHFDLIWPEGSHVLEVGCGVGAQTKILAAQNPKCFFTSIDISSRSIERAKEDSSLSNYNNIDFKHLDVYELETLDVKFDHLFICFVLEHVNDPENLLKYLRQFIKPKGTITIIEGDHGSAYFYPDSIEARKAITAQVRLQDQNGGNANIGREIFSLLDRSGYLNISVSPRCIYVDDNNSELKKNFILKTFTAMIEGMADSIVDLGIEKGGVINKGINDLKRTSQKYGTFSYTFFKGIGKNY